MSSTSPVPPVGGTMRDQLLASQTLPDWSICTAVRCWIALLRKPCGGDRTAPVVLPGGQAPVSVPHSVHTLGVRKPATHTRSDPSTATDQGSVFSGSSYAPATLPSGVSRVTVLLK
ncbi:hypothetical protein FRZ03_09235 [Streptomyces misionensis]|uniref:Uncharacterized protein n=1 Tax=Streptomyces misionensis TaxID=67331 RepID=A0A5C6JY75_9ACTN|nr:hypothetical protein FRZ03_09235 [Streptomyces misionensis]